MATLTVRIKEGKFFDSRGRYLYELTSDYVLGNGWECFIKENGTIVCYAVRDYSDGVHSMRYTISPDGFARLTLKINEQTEVLKKGYVVPKGMTIQNGILGLPGDYVDIRRPYFVSEDRQKVMQEFGLTSLRFVNPNREYTLRYAYYGGGDTKSKIWTDGQVKEKEADCGRTERWQESAPGTSAYEMTETVCVAGATWVVVEKDQDEGDRHNYSKILYTLEKNLSKLKLTLS